jgi:hypothetical protein
MKKLNQLILLMTTVCSLNSSAQTIPSYVSTVGLVGWWPFNGNANDVSANGYNGVVSGATLTVDRNGNANKAYSFDGITNYISVSGASAVSYTSGLTLNAWVKIDGVNTHTNCGMGCAQFIISRGEDSGDGHFKIASNQEPETSTGKRFLGGFNNGGYFTNFMGTTSYPYPQTNWHHIVFTYNNSQGKLYVDGLLNSTNTYTTAITTITNSILFGKHEKPGWSYLVKGKIDDIGIWNRALTDCEVKKLFDSGLGFTLSTSSSTICLGQSIVLTSSGATNYLWSTGATTSSITVTPTVTSVYTVTTTYSVGCNDMRTINVTVNPCTGINEYDDSQLLSIFPNPAKTEININTELKYQSLAVVNSIGQVILNNEKTNTLSIEGLSNGVYFIQLLDKESKVIGTKKFIKE